MRLFALYRQAEMHRKALVVQKRYLQCQVDAFFQTQQSALLMMADMGAPVNLGLHPPQSKYPRAYARFRAVGCVVIATLRFRYILRRKMYHLRSQINKLQKQSQLSSSSLHVHVGGEPSLSRVSVSNSEENSSRWVAGSERSNQRQQSPIGLSTGIQTVLSGHPTGTSQHSDPKVTPLIRATPHSSSQSFPSLQSVPPCQHKHVHELPSSKADSHSRLHSTQPFVKITGQSSGSGLSHALPIVKPLRQRQVSQPQLPHGTGMPKSPKISPSLSSSAKEKKEHTSTASTSTTRKQKAPSTRLPLKTPPAPTQDPQLTAYIKGLERLQARLSKTNM